MCGRYWIQAEDDELREIVVRAQATQNTSETNAFQSGDVYPGSIAPVLAHHADCMCWGFPRLNSGTLLINARSETAQASPMFRDAMLSRRCLIPASGYYEWKTLDNKKKEKYAFSLSDSKTIYMAGIFTKDNRFAILTREAVPEFYSIHNRMPVIIPNHLKDIWLNESAEVLHDSLTKLCCTYAEEKPKSGTEQISFFTLIHHP